MEIIGKSHAKFTVASVSQKQSKEKQAADSMNGIFRNHRRCLREGQEFPKLKLRGGWPQIGYFNCVCMCMYLWVSDAWN